jgi:membrane protease YdiL (CAAX protease family)
LLPFTLLLIFAVFATALVPAALLVPVHYRGLARRVRDRMPMPMFERIGLRHAWLAGAVVLIVPTLAVFAMRPDAIGALFSGGKENATTQFSVALVGSLLSLCVLLPWASRLRMPALPGRGVFRWQVALVVACCWLAIYAAGMLSHVVMQGLLGGDHATLQTKMVEALLHDGTSRHGLFVAWLMIAALTPVLEEMVFRGMLLGGMSRHISFGWSNFWQALLFASAHGDPPRFAVYFLMGLLAGWLTRRYRSLLPAIALHALNNSIAMVGLG